MPLAGWTEEWWVVVMEVGLDPELSKMVHALSKMVHALRSGYCPNREGI